MGESDVGRDNGSIISDVQAAVMLPRIRSRQRQKRVQRLGPKKRRRQQTPEKRQLSQYGHRIDMILSMWSQKSRNLIIRMIRESKLH